MALNGIRVCGIKEIYPIVDGLAPYFFIKSSTPKTCLLKNECFIVNASDC